MDTCLRISFIWYQRPFSAIHFVNLRLAFSSTLNPHYLKSKYLTLRGILEQAPPAFRATHNLRELLYRAAAPYQVYCSLEESPSTEIDPHFVDPIITFAMAEGDDAVRGQPEDIISIIFAAQDIIRWIEVSKASYLRIFGPDKETDVFNVTNYKAEVPAGCECEVIGGKGVRFT